MSTSIIKVKNLDVGDKLFVTEGPLSHFLPIVKIIHNHNPVTNEKFFDIQCKRKDLFENLFLHFRIDEEVLIQREIQKPVLQAIEAKDLKVGDDLLISEDNENHFVTIKEINFLVHEEHVFIKYGVLVKYEGGHILIIGDKKRVLVSRGENNV